MRATHVCIVLFKLFAASHGQCPCTTAENTTTMTPAPMAENADGDDGASSSGPSTGPAGPVSRLLRGMYIDSEVLEYVDRQLQEDNETDDAVNTTTMAPTTTVASAAEDTCPCPTPQVESTFTATLSLASADDLSALDLAAFQTELATNQDWGDNSVVMVPVVKVGMEYTLDVDITDLQCTAAAAVAFAVTEADVECGANSSATAPGRRLQTFTKSVTISFDDTQSAAAAATASQDTTQFAAALAGDGVAAVAVSENVSASVEVTFTVLADEAITEPSIEQLQLAVSDSSTSTITVTVAITGALASSFTRMPCSEPSVCGTGYSLADGAANWGCAGAVCTSAEEDICCVSAPSAPTTAGAQGTCVFGSLFSLFLWHSF